MYGPRVVRLPILCLTVLIAACGHQGASIWVVNQDAQDWYVRLDVSEVERRAYFIPAGATLAIFVDPHVSFRGRLRLMDSACTTREDVQIAAGDVDVVIKDGALTLVGRAGPSGRTYRPALPAPIPCDPGPPPLPP